MLVFAILVLPSIASSLASSPECSARMSRQDNRGTAAEPAVQPIDAPASS
ncbi:hypothetical protein ABZ990_06595 [Streptomyces sp. NPDC046203]